MTFNFAVSQKTRWLLAIAIAIAGSVVALNPFSSFSEDNAPTQKTVKVATGKSFLIGKYRATPVKSGNLDLVHVPIDEHITVVYLRKPTGGGGMGGINSGCLTCKISEIRSCADKVCPPIKAVDPDASCSDAILDCCADKCKSKCPSTTGGSLSVFMQ
jgi:hypothetical protein